MSAKQVFGEGQISLVACESLWQGKASRGFSEWVGDQLWQPGQWFVEQSLFRNWVTGFQQMCGASVTWYGCH